MNKKNDSFDPSKYSESELKKILIQSLLVLVVGTISGTYWACNVLFMAGHRLEGLWGLLFTLTIMCECSKDIYGGRCKRTLQQKKSSIVGILVDLAVGLLSLANPVMFGMSAVLLITDTRSLILEW